MQSSPTAAASPIVDIIIPVYRGLAETRACIESVLASVDPTPNEIIVVDDASPEREISEYLRNLAKEQKITLLTNERNLGFVRTCNRALALHIDRDVVLLNSDTVVANDWLMRLRRCAYVTEGVASVTPFSNNATLASYPKTFADNTIAPEQTPVLDAAFADANSGKSVDIPTAVGFCMFMRRHAIAAVGLFDEAAFGRGYGEENDWCLRAERAGFVHKLAADVFVWHRGGVSFAETAIAQQAMAGCVMEERYPDYKTVIQEFIGRDPSRPLRRAVDVLRIQKSKKTKVLFITHHWGGGTEQHVRDLAALTADDLEVMVLRPRGKDHTSLTWAREGEEFSAYFSVGGEWNLLLNVLSALGLQRVHLHHVHGHSIKILDIANALTLPLDITLHDYFPVTSRYHTLAGGALPPQDGSAHAWGLDDDAWRARMSALLNSASRVIAPSRDLADRIGVFFPKTKIDVRPHPEPALPQIPKITKVLVLGGMTNDKGLEVVLSCARDAKARGLPVVFKILGHTVQAIEQYPDIPLFVHGSYIEGELPLLIELERADAFLFPAQIPESFSYTLSFAKTTGLPIFASRLGAFVERLADYSEAHLLPWNSPPEKWNASILEAVGDSHMSGDTPHAASSVAVREYRSWYLSGIAAQQSRPSDPLTIPATVYFDHGRAESEPAKSLLSLFEMGVMSRHLPSRLQLERRIAQVDSERENLLRSVAYLRDTLQQRESELADVARLLADVQYETANRIVTLEMEQKAARDAFAEIAQSTSWKLTAPLRSSVTAVRVVKSRARNFVFRARRLPQQASMAGHILREEGAVELGRRVREKLTRPAGEMMVPVAQYELEVSIQPLIVPSADAPRISIIIPVYGQHLLTYTCLKSIAATCGDQAIEVIVVDDCSPEPAEFALRAVSGIKIIRNETNLGFLRNCNKAAAIAEGDYLVLLNNDTIVTDCWLQAMQAAFEQHESVGLVGVKLIYPDGALQEAGGIVWRDGSAWNVGRNDDARKPEYNYLRDVDYCSGACLMIEKAFWNELDGFDERYVPAYYEDTDLAFKVRAAGKRVLYQPNATVVHFEGQSSGTDLSSGVKQHQVTNLRTFARKWKDVLTTHRLNGVMPHLERDRYAKKRVLVIDACMLTPDQDAGSLRMFEILRVLCSLRCKVTFLAQNLEYREPYVTQIQGLGVEVLYHPYVPSVERYLERTIDQFDVVVMSRATVACQYIKLARNLTQARNLQTLLVFDTVDLHFVREERQAKLSGGVAESAIAQATRKQELAAMALADLSIVVSPAEKALLAELLPSARVEIVSTIHVAIPGNKAFDQRSGVIFIGGFRHPPNLDAITWYAENVLPILRQRGTKIVTTIVGSNAPPSLQNYAADDFVIAGFVEDLVPLYDAARLSISPLRYGAGVKGKINLAMQYGVPVVATSISIEGMYLEHDVNVLVADEPEAFADAIIRAYDDEVLWGRLRAGGIENIDTYFSRDRARDALKAIVGTGKD